VDRKGLLGPAFGDEAGHVQTYSTLTLMTTASSQAQTCSRSRGLRQLAGSHGGAGGSRPESLDCSVGGPLGTAIRKDRPPSLVKSDDQVAVNPRQANDHTTVPVGNRTRRAA
jgi:hypothetical protein